MPAITRIGDADVIHCSVPTRAAGSPDVFVNGIAVSRQGDANTTHMKNPPDCDVPHSTSITTGSTTVFVNSKGCGRVGDATGCTSVDAGSPNVFAGG